MRKTMMVTVFVTLAAGCAGLESPRAQLVTARTALTAVNRTLARQIQARAFDDDELADIQLLAHGAAELVDAWETAVRAGTTLPAADAEQLRTKMAALTAYTRKEPVDDGHE